MGFGFNLGMMFVVLPASLVLLLLWGLTQNNLFGKILGFGWSALGITVALTYIAYKLSAKVVLEKADYYGSYVIDRDFFPGRQADWQYDHFRFEIRPDDSLFFYVTEKERVLNTIRGRIGTVSPYGSARLVLTMAQPAHHIVADNPTTFRSSWRFYLVFDSRLFGNVFFKKGEWQPRDNP